MKSRFRIKIEHLYSICVTLAFGLLFFANSEKIGVELGVGKAFYFPCGMALILSFFIKDKLDRIDKAVIFLLIVTFISALSMPPDEDVKINEMAITRFVLGILCFWRIRSINPILIIRYIALVSPLIVLLHFVIVNPFGKGRFFGFYGDPNYLAISLDLVIIICYFRIKQIKNKLAILILAATICGSIILILLGISRGGILSVTILIILILIDLFRQNRKAFNIILFISIIFGGAAISALGDTLLNVETRISSKSTEAEASTEARFADYYSVANLMLAKPQYSILGIGIGNSKFAHITYRKYGYISPYTIHNTYLSIFAEQGIFAFLSIIIVIVQSMRSMWEKRNIITLFFFLATNISLLTLNCITFMPFWIIIFFISNKSFYENCNSIHLHR